MAETTGKGASEALATLVGRALRCLAPVQVVTSGWQLGVSNILRVFSQGSAAPGVVQLSRADRSPLLLLKVSIDYAVMLDGSGSLRPSYRAAISRYVYVVSDLNERELFAYHWHPFGVSDVGTPHLHVSAARDIFLSTQSAHTRAEAVPLGKLHFPTHHIEPPELVRFLITELGVGPRRADWESVLDQIERSTP